MAILQLVTQEDSLFPVSGDLPPPMLTAEADLRDEVDMPVALRRLLTSDTWIGGTGDQKAASMCLWLESWHQVPAGSLPSGDRMLAILSQAGAAWESVKAHALKGWVLCSDGRYYHPVVVEKALEVIRLRTGNRSKTTRARASLLSKREDQAVGIGIDMDTLEWSGITEKHLSTWRKTAPDVDIKGELAKAAGWLLVNPKRQKSNYARFLTNWMNSAQSRLLDHAGTMPPRLESIEHTSDAFRAFWNDYPNQTKIIYAWEQWQAQRIDADPGKQDAIRAGLIRWKASREWRDENGRFIPAPHNWLKDMRWLESPRPYSSVSTDRHGKTNYDRGTVCRDYGKTGEF